MRPFFACLLLCAPCAGFAAPNSAPQALPIAETIPAPRDIAWPGPLRLAVDAANVTQGIFRVAETIPVSAGPLTLLYPQWLPGNHSPNGPIAMLAGLKFRSGGQSIPWHRDSIDVYAFHLEVPPGATRLQAEFQYLSPTDSKQGAITNDRDWGELTYSFEDIVQALNHVQAYDWAQFLRDRLVTVRPHAPLDGLSRGGYQLVFTDTESDWLKALETEEDYTDLRYSVGLLIGKDAEITGVIWDGPAFNAGLTVGTKLIAVDGRAYDVDDLKAAIKAEESPLSLLVRTGDRFRTVALSFDGGLRYPALKKIDPHAHSLDDLLAPKP
jgi:hypothetical protein